VTNRFAVHLFYIRHSFYKISDDNNEKNIGHTWTTNLNTWGLNPPDTAALAVRPGKFDALHVWAPTIVKRGPTFFMFYTGVRDDGGKQHQRIAVATSTDLNTWTRADTVVLSAPMIRWAMKAPGLDYGSAQQLRDPFVMPDPVNSGKWLMYFVALDSLTNKLAVGAARSPDLRTWTALHDPFSSTERPTSLGETTSVESPHVFRRNGQWWMQYTVNGERVFFETSASSDPADTVATHWTNPVQLFDVTEGPLPELRWWHSTEYLMMQPGVEYLAAWRDSTEGNIDIKGIYATSVPTDSFALSCPAVSGVNDRAPVPEHVGMSILSRRWGAPEATVRIELPSAMSVRLAIHDIAGRRRKLLLVRDLPGGMTDVSWDGRDERGIRVPSGMYFIRLTYASGARVSKVIILR
jgi:sucrose-6-phosphate hydrolase SacC (GH32 family)